MDHIQQQLPYQDTKAYKTTNHSSTETQFAEAHDGLAGIMGYLLNVEIPPLVKRGILRNAMKISTNLEDGERRLQELIALNNKLVATRRIKLGTWSICPDSAEIALNRRREHRETGGHASNKDTQNERDDHNELLESPPWKIDKSHMTRMVADK